MNTQYYTEQLISRFYEEQEDILLGVLAAGVPLSDIVLTEPEMEWDSNTVTMKSMVGFKPDFRYGDQWSPEEIEKIQQNVEKAKEIEAALEEKERIKNAL